MGADTVWANTKLLEMRDKARARSYLFGEHAEFSGRYQTLVDSVDRLREDVDAIIARANKANELGTITDEELNIVLEEVLQYRVALGQDLD